MVNLLTRRTWTRIGQTVLLLIAGVLFLIGIGYWVGIVWNQ